MTCGDRQDVIRYNGTVCFERSSQGEEHSTWVGGAVTKPRDGSSSAAVGSCDQHTGLMHFVHVRRKGAQLSIVVTFALVEKKKNKKQLGNRDQSKGSCNNKTKSKTKTTTTEKISAPCTGHLKDSLSVLCYLLILCNSENTAGAANSICKQIKWMSKKFSFSVQVINHLRKVEGRLAGTWDCSGDLHYAPSVSQENSNSARLLCLFPTISLGSIPRLISYA